MSKTDVPAESPDDWVMQDRVASRPGIDEERWTDRLGLWVSKWVPAEGCTLYHGDNAGTDYNIQLRCRRKHLPPVVEQPKVNTMKSIPPFRIAPIYDKHTDSMIIYIKDVPSFARYHNKQITFFLDRNDESLVGLEIKECKQLINNSDDNGINLGEKS